MVDVRVMQNIAHLNRCLRPFADELSVYAFGYSYGKDPVDDGGNPIEIDMFINNGLCHAYAWLLNERLTQMGIPNYKCGNSQHVWVEVGDTAYDCSGPIEFDPKAEFFNFDDHALLKIEFPHVYEAVITLRNILLKAVDAERWLTQCDKILRVPDVV